MKDNLKYLDNLWLSLGIYFTNFNLFYAVGLLNTSTYLHVPKVTSYIINIAYYILSTPVLLKSFKATLSLPCPTSVMLNLST